MLLEDPKKSILYCCANCNSHLDWGGAIETLQYLKEKGHNVTVASGESMRSVVTEKGLYFLDIGLNPIKRMEKGQELADVLALHRRDVFFNAENTASAFHRALDFSERTTIDVVVSDAFCRVSPLLAERRNIPFVVVAPETRSGNEPIVTQDRGSIRTFYKKLEMLTGQCLLNHDTSYPLNQVSPYLNIHYATKSFECQERDKTHVFVGGSMLKRKKSSRRHDRPQVYYSSGTLFWDQEQIDNVCELAETLAIDLFISKGAGLFEINRQKSNIHCFEFCDETRMFPEMDIVITQGGMGTVSKAIRAGAPLLVLPLFHGNYKQALRVSAYGNGIGILSKEEQARNLEKCAKEVLANPNYKAAAKRLQMEFDECGGHRKAGEHILHLCEV